MTDREVLEKIQSYLTERHKAFEDVPAMRHNADVKGLMNISLYMVTTLDGVEDILFDHGMGTPHEKKVRGVK